MTIDKHNCTKEEFYVLAKTKTEPVLELTIRKEMDDLLADIPAGEVYPPENPISTDIPPEPLVEMEVGEVLASTITESPAPTVSPEPKKSWKKVKAAK